MTFFFFLTKHEFWDISVRGDSAQRRDEEIAMATLCEDAGCVEDRLGGVVLHDQVRSRSNIVR